ncbi:uncharacterized protein LOC114276716 [Camellia sinensis]|uniref:uncharacterized protein LOC114276716 n=1 Tax=Camellia sinensis TaxID=4442 RepID=UPI001036EB85|nr:uncharacterized protein LOC114276716 [Camellia sinensis]
MIDELYKEVVKVVDEARKCYAEGLTEWFNDDEFAQMMLLDGCFILQYICSIVNESHIVLKIIHQAPLVRRDLFLLENQLPFIVLQVLMLLRFENLDGENMITVFIKRVRDVKVLRSKGILLNFFGSDQQVADIFNEIATELVPSPHAYVEVKTRIEKHHRNSMKIWMAEWHHTYFRSPRTFIAIAAAILAITLSVFQTILASIQTKLTAHPPKG